MNTTTGHWVTNAELDLSIKWKLTVKWRRAGGDLSAVLNLWRGANQGGVLVGARNNGTNNLGDELDLDYSAGLSLVGQLFRLTGTATTMTTEVVVDPATYAIRSYTQGELDTMTAAGITLPTVAEIAAHSFIQLRANSGGNIEIEEISLRYLDAPKVTTTWLFNATTAAAATPSAGGTWTVSTNNYYEVTTATGSIDFGNGLKLVRGSSDTATAIRPAQASTGLSPQITGCIQLGGNSPFNWGTLDGIANGQQFTLEIVYANTGSGNADDRYPVVVVGSVSTNAKGNSTANTSNAATGTVNLVGNGSAIQLQANAGIRIYKVTLTR